MKVSVIGCGRWGTFITWYLDHIGHQVSLYGRKQSKHMQELIERRRNDLLILSERIHLTTDLEEAVKSDMIVISINAQGLRSLMEELNTLGIHDKTFILCMKGLEIATGKRLTEVVRETADPSHKIAVWLGPGHVQEFYNGIPNCMVIDSQEELIKTQLVEAFSSKLIRFYYGQDLIGNEVGAAAKNVIGIAAGMLDGLHLTTLKGALMSRGTREVARLIKAMGGNELSAYGLCHLGDYEATVFSKFSHNRQFGESFVKGEAYGELAEGYYTVKALIQLQERYQIEMPIAQAVYDVLYKGEKARQRLELLFSRDLKAEFL